MKIRRAALPSSAEAGERISASKCRDATEVHCRWVLMNHDYHFGLVCLSLPAVYRGAVCGQSVERSVWTVKPVKCVDRLLWTVHTDDSMSRTRPLPPSASAVSLFLVGGVATRGYRDRVYLYRATETICTTRDHASGPGVNDQRNKRMKERF